MEKVVWVERNTSILCFQIAKRKPLLIQLVHFQRMSHWSSWMPTISDFSIWWKGFWNRMWKLCARLLMSATWTRYEASALSVKGISQEPYNCPDHNLIPSFFKNHFGYVKLYNDLTDGYTTWKAVIEKYDRELTRYHYTNCYASSKVILESTMHEFYPNHPICIMWPRRCRRHGFGTQADLPLFVKLACHPAMRAPCCEGKLNLVFVHDVAKDIIRGVSELAGSVQPNRKSRPFHPIYMSTSNSDLTFE